MICLIQWVRHATHVVPSVYPFPNTVSANKVSRQTPIASECRLAWMAPQNLVCARTGGIAITERLCNEMMGGGGGRKLVDASQGDLLSNRHRRSSQTS